MEPQTTAQITDAKEAFTRLLARRLVRHGVTAAQIYSEVRKQTLAEDNLGLNDGLVQSHSDGGWLFICPKCEEADGQINWYDPVEESREVGHVDDNGSLHIHYSRDFTDADSGDGYFCCGECGHEWPMSEAVGCAVEWD